LSYFLSTVRYSNQLSYAPKIFRSFTYVIFLSVRPFLDTRYDTRAISKGAGPQLPDRSAPAANHLPRCHQDRKPFYRAGPGWQARQALA
jgi:hypothetical protein